MNRGTWVGYGGSIGDVGIPSTPYGPPGGLAMGGQVEGLAVGLGRGVGCDGNLGGAGALGARYSQTRSSWVLEGIPGTAEL